MDNRKFLAGAFATPPAVPASPSSGYPTNGDVSNPATTPGDWWYHALGEEIRTVITAAGLTPTHNLVNQLLAALTAGWNLPKSLGAGGYLTLPGGLILQWGTATTAGGAGNWSATFPLAFPTAAYIGLSNILDSNETTQVFSITTTTITGSALNAATGVNSANGIGITWLALGK
jgi:hypothetical protein